MGSPKDDLFDMIEEFPYEYREWKNEVGHKYQGADYDQRAQSLKAFLVRKQKRLAVFLVQMES